MKSFLVWLLGPSKALQQAQSEIDYLRLELRRVNDLLTQAYETRGVVPVQAEHRQATAADTSAPRTIADLQANLDGQVERDRLAFESAEARRQEAMTQAKAAPVN